LAGGPACNDDGAGDARTWNLANPVNSVNPRTRIEVTEGDITVQAVDAIVNAANNELWMGAGVAGAIKTRGGAEIERDAMAKGPIGVGEAIATGAGRLAARYVIHAAVMGQDLQTDATLVRNATASALAVAAQLGLTSIALPALGTGVGAFPLERCAQVMLGAVRDHAAGPTSLTRVVFVLWGRPAYETFAAVVAQASDHP